MQSITIANNIYLISGLGADKRIFDRLSFPENMRIHHIQWISPLNNEPLAAYASRLIEQIDTKEPFILAGVSFGGMIAVELAKILRPELVILISSASVASEIPWYFHFAGWLQLPALIPTSILKKANQVSYWFFGVKERDEKALLKQILKDTDPHFLKWAIQQIGAWKNTQSPEKLVHLHGKQDRVLPLRFIRKPVVEMEGGHLMVYTNADDVSNILKAEIRKTICNELSQNHIPKPQLDHHTSLVGNKKDCLQLNYAGGRLLKLIHCSCKHPVGLYRNCPCFKCWLYNWINYRDSNHPEFKR